MACVWVYYHWTLGLYVIWIKLYDLSMLLLSSDHWIIFGTCYRFLPFFSFGFFQAAGMDRPIVSPYNASAYINSVPTLDLPNIIPPPAHVTSWQGIIRMRLVSLLGCLLLEAMRCDFFPYN